MMDACGRMSPTAAIVMLMGGSVVVVVEVGCCGGAAVVDVVVWPGGSVVATTTLRGTVTVACESSVGVVWASLAGQKMIGAHKAITARATPTAFSTLRTVVTSRGHRPWNALVGVIVACRMALRHAEYRLPSGDARCQP